MTYAVAQRLRPRRPRDARRARTAPSSTAGCSRGSSATTRRGDRGARRATSRSPRPRRSRRSSTTLSNWYVRRSRRRFWRTDPDAPTSDSLAAHATLHEVLDRTVGPARPDLPVPRGPPLRGAARRARRRLGAPRATGPSPTRPRSTRRSRRQMAVGARARLARPRRARRGRRQGPPATAPRARLPAGGHRRAAARRRRGRAQRRPRRVLRRALRRPHLRAAPELPVARPAARRARPGGPRRARRARPGGRGARRSRTAARHGRGSAATTWRSRGDDVELRVRAEAGFAVSRDGREVVALDLELDDELRRRGVVRELVRQIQELRKDSGLRGGRPRRAVARRARARRPTSAPPWPARSSPTPCTTVPGPGGPAHVELADGARGDGRGLRSPAELSRPRRTPAVRRSACAARTRARRAPRSVSFERARRRRGAGRGPRCASLSVALAVRGEPDVHGAAVARARPPARRVPGPRCGRRAASSRPRSTRSGSASADMDRKPPSARVDPEQHLEPGERQPDGVLERGPELALEPGVGLEEEPEQDHAAVRARARRRRRSWCAGTVAHGTNPSRRAPGPPLTAQ